MRTISVTRSISVRASPEDVIGILGDARQLLGSHDHGD
jgi:hypothetical protein